MPSVCQTYGWTVNKRYTIICPAYKGLKYDLYGINSHWRFFTFVYIFTGKKFVSYRIKQLVSVICKKGIVAP